MNDPAFDSTRRALAFAFNHLDASIPAPMMVRMMAEITPATKKPKKGTLAETLSKRSGPPANPGARLRGLDKTLQAGFILQQVARLDPPHKNSLAARFTRFSDPCSCGSPCCRGFRFNIRWNQAINDLCQIVKESGDVLRVKGKKGLSTDPRLRRLIIERFFRSDATGWSLASIARQAEVTPATASLHTSWIEDYLTQNETDAMLQIDAIFDQTGITGLIV